MRMLNTVAHLNNAVMNSRERADTQLSVSLGSDPCSAGQCDVQGVSPSFCALTYSPLK